MLIESRINSNYFMSKKGHLNEQFRKQVSCDILVHIFNMDQFFEGFRSIYISALPVMDH